MATLLPKFILKKLPQIVLGTSDGHIYLTFDDGPDPEITPLILDLLQKLKIKASFFVLGRKAEQFGSIVQRIHLEGHAVGNHSYSHPKMLWKTARVVQQEIELTDAILKSIIGQPPTIFRPPYGQVAPQVLWSMRKTGHSIILWNASTGDYKTGADEDKIAFRLRKNLKPGKIILLHDGHENSLATFRALQKVLNGGISHTQSFAALNLNMRS